jgi:3-oxoacyl-[acyl-carrier-protein] synthase-3
MESGFNVGIVGVGHHVPDNLVSNAKLAESFGCSEEWILRRTGIEERRVVSNGDATSDLGARAAERALQSAGVSAEEVDLLICATFTPDMSFPATACLIQEKIGARRAGAFDLQAACSGFVYALSTAVQYVASGFQRNVLVVASEVNSSIVDTRDRKVAALFGDGAGAALVAPVEDGGVLALHLGADGSGGDHFRRPAGGSRLPASAETVQEGLHYIHMNGRALFRFGVETMVKASLQCLEKAGLGIEDVDLFIPHQANLRMVEAGIERLGIPRERTVVNLQRYANTSAATIPIALWEAVAGGRLAPGDLLLMTGFGAGLTWGSVLMRWGGPLALTTSRRAG